MSHRKELYATQVGGRKTKANAPKIGRNARCMNCPLDAVVITDHRNGNQVCSSCGMVLESSVISQEQEWRNFSNTEEANTDRSRVGGPNDQWMKDTAGSTSMIGAEGLFKRMAALQDASTAVTGGDRQLRNAFRNLIEIQNFFHLKEATMERCREMVKDMEIVGVLKNKTGQPHMLAILYMALREERVCKGLEYFCKIDSTLQPRELAKHVNRLKKHQAQRKRLVAAGASSAELIPRFATSIGLSPACCALASSICTKAEQFPDGTPANILAAAAIQYTLTLCDLSIPTPDDVAMSARAGVASVLRALQMMTTNKASIVTPDIEKKIAQIKGSQNE